MKENDRDLKFEVKPSIWFLLYSAVMFSIGTITTIFREVIDIYTIFFLIMTIGPLLYFINVRIYVYKYHFAKRDIFRRTKKYALRDVDIEYRGMLEGADVWAIVDKNGKRIMFISEDFTNREGLEKAILKNKASSRGCVQQHRLWE